MVISSAMSSTVPLGRSGLGLAALSHGSAHLEDRFLADPLDQVMIRKMFIDHDLQHAFAVAQINEGHAPQFAHVVHPAIEGDGLPHLVFADLRRSNSPVSKVFFQPFVQVLAGDTHLFLGLSCF